MRQILTRTKGILLFCFHLILCSSVSAQYTLNWASSFAPSWANGATSGNAFNIGGSGINCNVNIVKSGGVFASSSGISAPTVTYSLITVAGSSSNLMLALDYSNPSQYTDVTFTFSAPVYSLSFNLADIDRLDNISNSYFDRVTITGSIGATTISPTITKYNATTDPNFLSIAGNVAQVNKTSGQAGNTASDASDQKGTIRVSFSGQMVTSVKIRYDNVSGVAADPGLQFIGVGNVRFFNAIPLSVQLTSFDGKGGNGKNTLKWQTANEIEMAYYAIERSENGKDFSEVSRVISYNSTVSREYVFYDNNAGNYNYYRLKMVNNDGSYTYSKTMLVGSNNTSELKVFPTIFTSSLTVRIPSLKEEIISLKLVDLWGKIVYQYTYKANRGVNEFSIEVPARLSRGQYFVVTGNRDQSIVVLKQ